VYAKRPFGHPSGFEYLGRYTTKVAISNHRILDINKKQTTFSYQGYSTGSPEAGNDLGDNPGVIPEGSPCIPLPEASGSYPRIVTDPALRHPGSSAKAGGRFHLSTNK